MYIKMYSCLLEQGTWNKFYSKRQLYTQGISCFFMLLWYTQVNMHVLEKKKYGRVTVKKEEQLAQVRATHMMYVHLYLSLKIFLLLLNE